ncbi:hypothetical protein CVT24_012649 [Panaeolus cyanescens]|uniref:Uncharacterized protein n=1 Tax=Panaeolus cyanescens TaxID=181874 RepID=A0A409W2B9_9AGAR|nr:hypothetical protein CVT24_012649 [Panaeolus cyanescens]
MIEGGTRLTRFMNTQASALDILLSNLDPVKQAPDAAVWKVSLQRGNLTHNAYGRWLYSDLVSRIEELWLRKECLEFDLAQINATEDVELHTILEGQLHDVMRTLHKFATQLAEFGPRPEGMRCLQGDVATHVKLNYGRQMYAALLSSLKNAWSLKRSLESDIVKAVKRAPRSRRQQLRASFEDELQKAMPNLHNCAKQLIEFGLPPDDMSGPDGDLAAYIERKPWLEDSEGLEMVIPGLEDTESPFSAIVSRVRDFFW